MGLFSKKKDGSEPASGSAAVGAGAGSGSSPTSANGTESFDFSPEKARKFFERAATLHEAENFEYAMNLWLGGLRQDPSDLSGLDGFLRSASAYMQTGGKGTPRDLSKLFSGRSQVERLLSAVLEWGVKPKEPHLAIRAMEQAAGLGLEQMATHIADMAFGAVKQDKKPRKEHLLEIMEVYKRFERFDKAVVVGEAASAADPSNARLQAEVRNMSAQLTMSKAGFDNAGKEGGFRSNLRDSENQRRLEDEQRIVKSEDVLERLVEQYVADYKKNPLDKPTIVNLTRALLQRRKKNDEETALKIYARAYQDTQDFRFKVATDEIRLAQLKVRAADLKRAASANPGDEAAQGALRQVAREYAELQLESLEAQVKAYPTDLGRKFDLGKIYAARGRHEEAIQLFQEAKNEVRIRATVLGQLAASFAAINWNDEAVETYRQALQTHGAPDDPTGMELRYGLMASLLGRSRERRTLADAMEADKIASSIAIQQIGYKDIRARRDEIKKLAEELRAGGSGGGGAGGSGGG